jgi:hypothetical protein
LLGRVLAIADFRVTPGADEGTSVHVTSFEVASSRVMTFDSHQSDHG